MEFHKPKPETIEAFLALIPSDPAIEHRKMFGQPACFTGGNMFAGLFGEAMILRLSEPDRAAFLALPGAAPFEPMGRRMREYVVAPPAMFANQANVAPWLRKAVAYASSLPAKTARKAARKKTAG